jgi:hypothetical protein
MQDPNEAPSPATAASSRKVNASPTRKKAPPPTPPPSEPLPENAPQWLKKLYDFLSKLEAWSYDFNAGYKPKYSGKPLDMTKDFQEKCFVSFLMIALALDALHSIYLDRIGERKLVDPPAVQLYKQRQKETREQERRDKLHKS